MQYTRESAVDRLLKSYQAYYNITMCEEAQKPLIAICEFFQHAEGYLLSRKANLWSAQCEEFLYLYNIENLTKEIFEKCRDDVWEDARQRAHIGPDHMYTYATAIFVCDTCQEDARLALQKSRVYKSFRFSLHGWMEFHAALLEVKEENRITFNKSGRGAGEVLENLLLENKKKRRRFF